MLLRDLNTNRSHINSLLLELGHIRIIVEEVVHGMMVRATYIYVFISQLTLHSTDARIDQAHPNMVDVVFDHSHHAICAPGTR
jgi:hypothetical protein